MLNRMAGLLLVSACIAPCVAHAATQGRLPVTSFTAADGLSSDALTAFYTDSRGFLWIGSFDGLSRFDGKRFVTWGVEDGLPHRVVGDIIEDGSGGIWIGTQGGAVRIDPTAPADHPFTRVPSPSPEVLAFAIDERGVIWSSCGDDLCFSRGGRLVRDDAFRAVGARAVRSIVFSPARELWVGTRHGLMHRTARGAWRHIDVHPHKESDDVDPFFDPDGRLWLSTPFETIVCDPPKEDGDRRPLTERVTARFTPAMTLPRTGTVAITAPWRSPLIGCGPASRSRDGAIWIGLNFGLLRIKEGRIDFFDEASGLPRDGIGAVGQDAGGNLWLATYGSGAIRMSTTGPMTFTTAHGLSDDRITSIVDLGDSLCVTNASGLSCFEGDEVRNGAIIPRSVIYAGWGWNQVATHDAGGHWWCATGQGLVEWPAGKIEEWGRIPPLRIYTARDGLGGDEVFRVWADSRGDLWISTFGERVLTRRDARTGTFTAFGEADGVPRVAPTAFAEDRAGNIWIGLYTGGLLRYANGRFERFSEELPKGFVRDLEIDASGRLWMATSSEGIACIDDPTSARIHPRRYTMSNGLSSNVAYCLAATRDGRIAIGSTRGVDLFDPKTKRVSHLTVADGLPTNQITVAHADRQGVLWLGTPRGLARLRFLPSAGVSHPRQPRITSVAVDGVPVATPVLGSVLQSGIHVPYPQRRMAISFGVADFDAVHALRFQYRLGEDAQWTDAGARREAVYERLPYGSEVFEVRTVAQDGSTSTAARVAFDVEAPLWLRPWFVAAVLAAIGFTAIVLHRARVERLVAVERLRTRVATDLHDDLGSSLSRISILSEVAKQKGDERLLDEIGDTARSLVDALGDSIWSVDPRRDDVQSLLSRVRHFAAGLLEARSIRLEVRVAPEVAALRLDPELRRELYLILKEALNNAAKHSGAQHVVVTSDLEGGRLHVAVEDNGVGMTKIPIARGEHNGHGVMNMMERAQRVGGNVAIDAAPGGGTRISVAVPV